MGKRHWFLSVLIFLSANYSQAGQASESTTLQQEPRHLWQDIQKGWQWVGDTIIDYIDPAQAEYRAKEEQQRAIELATALHHEILSGDTSSVATVLARGANPNSTTADGRPVIFEAALHGFWDVVALLLNHGADPNSKDRGGHSSIIWYAVVNNKPEIVNLLLQKGADPNSKVKGGYPIIAQAAGYHFWDIVALLLNGGADPNASYHAISEATKSGRVDIVDLLLKKGLNPNAQSGDSIISEAVMWNQPEMVKLLLHYGVDPNSKNLNDESLLDYARRLNFQEVANVLVQYGATIDSQNADGETVLMKEVALKHMQEIASLIKLGANPYLTDDSGANAFDYAQQDQEILNLLRKTKHTSAQDADRARQLSRRSIGERLNAFFRRIWPQFQMVQHVDSDQTMPACAAGCTTSQMYAQICEHDMAKQKIDLTLLLQREREYWATHYVFYHAQNSAHRIAQDFWQQVLSLVHLEYHADFIPVRFSESTKMLANSNPEKFLLAHTMIPKCKESGHKHSDTNPDIRRHLLSVNLALTGNLHDYGECSLSYYLGNQSIQKFATAELLGEIFEYYALNQSFIKDLIAFEQSLGRNFGSLLQIFIPQQKVNDCVYLARPWGCPYTKNLGFPGYKVINGYGYQAEIAPVLDWIRRRGAARDQLTKDVLEALQARIVLGTDIVLNPRSGVKIFREVNLPPQKLAWYEQQVGAIARKVMIDWLQRMQQKTITTEIIERLKETPLYAIITNPEKRQRLLDELSKDE